MNAYDLKKKTGTVIALREMTVPEQNIFMDKQPGKDFNRPQYKRLVKIRGRAICSASRASTGQDAITPKFWSGGGF